MTKERAGLLDRISLVRDSVAFSGVESDVYRLPRSCVAHNGSAQGRVHATRPSRAYRLVELLKRVERFLVLSRVLIERVVRACPSPTLQNMYPIDVLVEPGMLINNKYLLPLVALQKLDFFVQLEVVVP